MLQCLGCVLVTFGQQEICEQEHRNYMDELDNHGDICVVGKYHFSVWTSVGKEWQSEGYIPLQYIYV